MLSKKFDITLLTEMLKYIIPAGYGIKYHFYTPNEFKTAIFERDVVNIVLISSIDHSKVRNGVRSIDDNKTESEILSNINTSTILKNNKAILNKEVSNHE